MKTTVTSLILTIALAAFAPISRADSNGNGIDEVGEIATNFTIQQHNSSAPLRLSDYAGSVILLDYFAYWCPYCRAQSPQIETAISDYYSVRKGNSNGVPVTVITVSFDGGNPTYTDQLIAQFGLDIVADDFSLVSYYQFGVQGQPYYVIINGLTNSTSHAAWQVLHRQGSYGGTIAPIDTLRSVIEQVQAAPPIITNFRPAAAGGFELTIPGQLGRTNRVEFSSNLTSWQTLTNVWGTNAPITVRDAAQPVSNRFYRVRRM